MVEMHVFGLAVDEKSQTPVLILKDDSEELVLPIWIGAMEAMAISLALNKVDFPRPMTHDLLLLVIAGLGGEISAVEIVRMEEGTFYAELVIDQENEQDNANAPDNAQKTVQRRIDCRPSDAVALAVRCGAPVFAAPAVLEEAGIKSMDGYEEVLKTEEAGKWTEELEKFDPDGKYKM